MKVSLYILKHLKVCWHYKLFPEFAFASAVNLASSVTESNIQHHSARNKHGRGVLITMFEGGPVDHHQC
jgi:hypothetical protein